MGARPAADPPAEAGLFIASAIASATRQHLNAAGRQPIWITAGLRRLGPLGCNRNPSAQNSDRKREGRYRAAKDPAASAPNPAPMAGKVAQRLPSGCPGAPRSAKPHRPFARHIAPLTAVAFAAVLLGSLPSSGPLGELFYDLRGAFSFDGSRCRRSPPARRARCAYSARRPFPPLPSISRAALTALARAVTVATSMTAR